MNTDSTIAAYLSIGLKFNGQKNLTSFIWVFLPLFVVDLCWHDNYQRCGKVLSTWIKLPYSSEKSEFIYITVLVIYIVYSSTYIHRFTLNTVYINKANTVPLCLLLMKCWPVFKLSFYLCCYLSLDSLRYSWWPTGRLAGKIFSLQAGPD